MTKLLIIEDDKVVAQMYRTKFIHAGFETRLALDGKEGLQMLEDFQPDIVQLDLMLPYVNGIETIQYIRNHPALKNILIVVFSNSYLADMIQNAWKAGADKCLSKVECTPKLMVEIVQRMIKEKAEKEKSSAAPQLEEQRSRGAREESSHTASEREFRTSPSAARFPGTPPEVDDDDFQDEQREALKKSIPVSLNEMQSGLKRLHAAAESNDKSEALQFLYKKARTLATNAAMTGMQSAAEIISAFEAFLRQLKDDPDKLTASTLKTTAQGLDFLKGLLAARTIRFNERWKLSRILVVDDEALSQRAIAHALKKIQLTCLLLDNAEAALSALRLNEFDLIFLDVDLPGMSGFELCKKARTLRLHKTTPVIFVTGLTDFTSRAQSTLSGGTDIMAKPFVFMELALKALALLHR